mmetsp:Transcript_41827/g.100460  ORF Transcript_41827/g.100460 Transcript_41827/m.100460 type:complete len:234 (+) Transcript_41827:473-1174(+)
MAGALPPPPPPPLETSAVSVPAGMPLASTSWRSPAHFPVEARAFIGRRPAPMNLSLEKLSFSHKLNTSSGSPSQTICPVQLKVGLDPASFISWVLANFPAMGGPGNSTFTYGSIFPNQFGSFKFVPLKMEMRSTVELARLTCTVPAAFPEASCRGTSPWNCMLATEAMGSCPEAMKVSERTLFASQTWNMSAGSPSHTRVVLKLNWGFFPASCFSGVWAFFPGCLASVKNTLT